MLDLGVSLFLGRITIALMILCIGLTILWQANSIFKSPRWRTIVTSSGVIVTVALALYTYSFSGPIVRSIFESLKYQ